MRRLASGNPHSDRSLRKILGAILAACGVGLRFKRTARTAAMALGSLLFLYTLIFEVPRYTAAPGSMTFRTQVFEPLAIAALAWLLPGQATPNWLGHASRYLLVVSFIVFGVDHFLALAPIGTLIPPWIPWHVFWIAFFGAGFVAAGLSLAFNFLPDWGAASIGLMCAIWVVTFTFPEQLLGSTGEVARALPTSGRVCSSPLLCGEVHGLWLRMVKFGVSGKSEGPGPMDFMVLTTFRFIQKSWNAAIVKVFLEFAKKKGLLVKDLHICSTRQLFHGRQPKNYVLDVYFYH